jgi:hypothetical protein
MTGEQRLSTLVALADWVRDNVNVGAIALDGAQALVWFYFDLTLVYEAIARGTEATLDKNSPFLAAGDEGKYLGPLGTPLGETHPVWGLIRVA